MPEGAGAWVCRPREAEGRDETSTGPTFYVPTDKGGTGRQPLELERRPLIEQTAPADDDDGWRRVAIDVEAGRIELYLDDVELNERPIPAERVITDLANVDAGYAGVTPGTSARRGPRRRVSTTSSMSSANRVAVIEDDPTARRAGSAVVPLGSLVGFSGRTQHAQQPLRNLLIQEVVSECAQRLIELRVAILRPGPDHWLGLLILGQAGISRDYWVRLSCRQAITC
jgi:hypothetical protein